MEPFGAREQVAEGRLAGIGPINEDFTCRRVVAHERFFPVPVRTLRPNWDAVPTWNSAIISNASPWVLRAVVPAVIKLF